MAEREKKIENRTAYSDINNNNNQQCGLAAGQKENSALFEL